MTTHFGYFLCVYYHSYIMAAFCCNELLPNTFALDSDSVEDVTNTIKLNRISNQLNCAESNESILSTSEVDSGGRTILLAIVFTPRVTLFLLELPYPGAALIFSLLRLVGIQLLIELSSNILNTIRIKSESIMGSIESQSIELC